MARSYSVVHDDFLTVYNFFSHAPDKEGEFPCFLGIVMFDGEPMLHSLDWDHDGPMKEAISELKRYYQEQYNRSVEVVVFESFRKYEA